MELQIKGMNTVVERFGEWPSFHDAEIIELHLNRESISWLKILICNEKENKKKDLKSEKQVVVKFILDKITDLELADFSSQNVIFGCEIEKNNDSYKLVLKPCYGLAGFLVAENISVEIDSHESV